jgi:hypothetical protein
MVQLLTLTFLMYIITLFLSFIPVPSPNHSQGLVISSPATESHLLHWLATFLHYLFTGLWVLPVFWISKPINVIWFQDIASAALNESQKLKKTKSQQSSSSQSVSQSISRFIADLLFSILLQLLFLLQVIHYSYIQEQLNVWYQNECKTLYGSECDVLVVLQM